MKDIPLDVLKHHHIVAVVGSQTFKSPVVFKRVLDHLSLKWPEKTAFISGGAVGVDTDFRNWCRQFGSPKSFFIEVTPTRFGDSELYFLRNAIIASLANELIGFIQRNKYRSGTWNTINHYRKQLKAFPGDKWGYTVYDENGNVWDRKWKD